MKRIMQLPHVETSVTIKLKESEMRALNALTVYGTDHFLKVFYEKLGQSYLRPHEQGLRDLFDTIRTELPPILKRATAARTAFALKDPIVRSREEYEEMLKGLNNDKRS